MFKFLKNLFEKEITRTDVLKKIKKKYKNWMPIKIESYPYPACDGRCHYNSFDIMKSEGYPVHALLIGGTRGEGVVHFVNKKPDGNYMDITWSDYFKGISKEAVLLEEYTEQVMNPYRELVKHKENVYAKIGITINEYDSRFHKII